MTTNWYHYLKSRPNNSIIICSPPKTADITLNYMLDKYNLKMQNEGREEASIDYINLSHMSKLINRKRDEKILGKLKIIMGVREPISQNISIMFQQFTGGEFHNDWILGDLEGKRNRKILLKELDYIFIEQKDDIQINFNSFIERYVYGDKRTTHTRSIQKFIEEFNKYVICLYRYDFNKLKGYTIIREGNLEVFVYQLEKLNDLKLELTEWMGITTDKLVEANVAVDKWIGETYKQAQQEIEITQEYFDKCFSEPYVQHCYSQVDIEKFKERWRPHITKVN